MKRLNITIATLTIMMAGMILPGIAMAGDLPARGLTAQQLDLQKAKTILLDMLDRLETHFENTKAKAAALQKLTETSGIDISQVIEGYLTQIQDLKTKAANVKTAKELKIVAQAVHSLIINAKTDVKKTISHRVEIHIDKFTQNPDRAKPLIDLAHRRIMQMQNQGADIQNVNKDLEDCEQLMQKGHEHLEEAKNKFRKFQELSRDEENEDGELMKDGMEMVRDARDTFGQARQNCSRVMKELKVH